MKISIRLNFLFHSYYGSLGMLLFSLPAHSHISEKRNDPLKTENAVYMTPLLELLPPSRVKRIRFPAGRYCFPPNVRMKQMKRQLPTYYPQLEACVALDETDTIIPTFDVS